MSEKKSNGQVPEEGPDGKNLEQSEKRKKTISQMRLWSVFKMRTSILNTATTEQMGYRVFPFFVYTKSTN